MEYLLFIGIVQALFTSVFLGSKPTGALGDRLLAAWMVAVALPMIGGTARSLWPDLRIPLLSADLIFPLTYGPFLWLYVRAVTGDISRLTWRELVHFLPFALVSLVQLASGWAPAPPHPDAGSFSTPIRLVGAANALSMLFYAARVVRRLRRHGNDVVQHFSSLTNRITLRWLFWLALGISAVFLLLFLATALSLPGLLEVQLPAQVAMIMALSFFGLRQTRVFDGAPDADDDAQDDPPAPADRPAPTEPNPPATGPGTATKTSYSRSGLTEERAERIAAKLDAVMQAQEPYLSPDLTIEQLAKRMAVPRHHLTEVISTRHNKNFFVFVNDYRIEAVKQAMQDPANADETLLDLAYACGFNSKAPFNAAFKRLTGVTPSQYRARLP